VILTDERWQELLHVRATNPGAIRQAYATRKRRAKLLSDNGTLFLVAADHPAQRHHRGPRRDRLPGQIPRQRRRAQTAIPGQCPDPEP